MYIYTYIYICIYIYIYEYIKENKTHVKCTYIFFNLVASSPS